MKTIRYTIIFILSLFAVSCSYLDIVPDSIATIEDNAFSMRTQAEKYLFTCYAYMPMSGHYNQDPTLLSGDEIWLSAEYGSANNPKNIALGNQRASSPYMDFWSGINGGKNLFRGISDCNIFLANISRVPDMSQAEKERWIAEVEFLKAYFHFYLIRMYGPIPIKDKNLNSNAPTADLQVYRNTLDECFDYVDNKLDSIIKLKHLPDLITDEATELGRITQGIALTLRAKVLVTAASPLFNGNTDYIGLKDGRGIEIFNPQKSEEQKREKWAKAVQACKEAIEFLQGYGKDQLYKYTSLEYAGLSDITRAKLSIRGSLTEKWNSEIIWGYSSVWVGEYQVQGIPRDLNSAKSTANTANRNNWAVPLKIAYQFYTKNGVPITEDKTWNYNERFAVKQVDVDQQYLLAIGEQTVGLNFDRELRYYASLGFDRGIWFGQGEGVTSETSQYPKARYGEFTANAITHSWNVTGIWPKKVVHFKSSVAASGTGLTQVKYPFPVFRVPDLYLMYAEALNEAADNENNRIEAIKWIDLVRERAGLKGVAESWTNYSTQPEKFHTQKGLREIIQQETLIEFVFEGHRFWDLRRWKTAMTEYNKPITGWNLRYSNPAEYYTETYIYTPRFSPKDYFWPIRDEEILRNGNTLQNYGW